jgi:hypothetical protein
MIKNYIFNLTYLKSNQYLNKINDQNDYNIKDLNKVENFVNRYNELYTYNNNNDLEINYNNKIDNKNTNNNININIKFIESLIKKREDSLLVNISKDNEENNYCYKYNNNNGTLKLLNKKLKREKFNYKNYNLINDKIDNNNDNYIQVITSDNVDNNQYHIIKEIIFKQNLLIKQFLDIHYQSHSQSQNLYEN